MLTIKRYGSDSRDRPSPLADRKRELRALTAILLLAGIARAGVALLTTSWVFPLEQNSWHFGYEMGQIAASIATGAGFSWPAWSSYPEGPTAWMPPVYPILIAAVFKLFGVYSSAAAIAILVFQTIASLLTCVFLYLIGKRIFNARVGLLTSFFFALYTPSIHFAVQKVWASSLFVCCLSLFVLNVLQLRSDTNVKKGLWVGLLGGFAALIDPIILISYPFVGLWLYSHSRASPVIKYGVLGVALSGCFVTIAPWLIRNYIVFGRYVFIKSNLGNELFLGNNPHASGIFNVPESHESLTFTEREFLKLADEPSRNALLFQKALLFVSAHPLEFLKLTGSRFVHYGTFMMRPATSTSQKISIVIYFAVLIAGIAGLFFRDLRRADLQVMLLFIMTLPLPYYFTVVGLFRYRFPVEVVLLLPAAYTAYRILVSSATFFANRHQRRNVLRRPAIVVMQDKSRN